MPNCVVLHTSSEFAESRVAVLRQILKSGPDLVSVVGVDVENWEEAIDMLCVMLDMSGEMPGAFCNTTAHDGETVQEVVAFAEQWCQLKGWPKTEVAVVEA